MMLSERVFDQEFCSLGMKFVSHKTHCDLDLHGRNCGTEISHAHQIVGGTGKSKNPVHFAHSAMPYLPQERNRLQPTKAFFDPLPLSLTDGIPSMSRSTAINGAGAPSRMILRHVRGNSHTSTLFHKTLGIESFVSAHGGRLRSRNLLQHDQRRVAFRRSIGLEDFGIDNSPLRFSTNRFPL